MICNFLRSKGEKWLTVCSFHIKNRRGAGGAIPCASGKGCGAELASTKFGQISSARKVIAALDVTKDKISYYRAYPVAG